MHESPSGSQYEDPIVPLSHLFSLQPHSEERPAWHRARPRGDWLPWHPSEGIGRGDDGDVLYPEEGERHSSQQGG